MAGGMGGTYSKAIAISGPDFLRMALLRALLF